MLEGTTRYWEVLQDNMEYRGVLQGTADNCGGTTGTAGYYGVLARYCGVLLGTGGDWGILEGTASTTRVQKVLWGTPGHW